MKSYAWLLVLMGLLIISTEVHAETWDVLSDKEQAVLDRILEHWETWVPERKADGTAPLMTADELFEGLTEEEIALLDRVRRIDPQKSFGFVGGHLGEPPHPVEFVKLVGQEFETAAGEIKKIGPQYLPETVFFAFADMMKAMREDIGTGLLVESGYRSQAYQLYTFLFYTPKHHYSLVETGHYVAIPGYSEHGAPHVQAIDFINLKGINGEDNPEEFEALPEYEWLQKHAAEYGFELSYPRNQPGITFEPWHWRYTGGAKDKAAAAGP